jgi:hypothetical protein
MNNKNNSGLSNFRNNIINNSMKNATKNNMMKNATKNNMMKNNMMNNATKNNNMKNNIMKNNIMNNSTKNNMMKNNDVKNNKMNSESPIYEYYKEMYGNNQKFSNSNNVAPLIENNYTLDDIEGNKPIYENDVSVLEPSNLEINSVDKPTSNIFYIVLIIILLVLLVLLYFYRKQIKDQLKKYYDSFFKPSNTQEKEIRQLNKSVKMEMKKREKSVNDKKNENKKKKGGVNQLVQKMKYDKDQISNSAGYCYIGEENGQRSCSEIYEGDICMSGDIFPSNELCMYPKLRQ